MRVPGASPAPFLYLTALVSGFCMMALEIIGARLLAPAFGSSVDVWAAVISVFILSLSIGYAVGGAIADRMPSNQWLAGTLVGAGVIYALLPIYAWPLTDALDWLHGKRYGSLVAAMVLFFPPSVLLGTVTPMLIRLSLVDVRRVGRVAGTLYAVGSVGNVLGILVCDYVLLVLVRDSHNLIAMGAALSTMGLLHAFLVIPVPLSARREVHRVDGRVSQ